MKNETKLETSMMVDMFLSCFQCLISKRIGDIDLAQKVVKSISFDYKQLQLKYEDVITLHMAFQAIDIKNNNSIPISELLQKVNFLFSARE